MNEKTDPDDEIIAASLKNAIAFVFEDAEENKIIKGSGILNISLGSHYYRIYTLHIFFF